MVLHNFPRGLRPPHPLPTPERAPKPTAVGATQLPRGDPPIYVDFVLPRNNTSETAFQRSVASLSALFTSHSLPRVVPMNELRARYSLFFHHYRDGSCPSYNVISNDNNNITLALPQYPREQRLLLFFGSGASHADDEETVRAFASLNDFAKRQQQVRQTMIAPLCANTAPHVDSGFVIPVYVDWADTTIVEQMLGQRPSTHSGGLPVSTAAVLVVMRQTKHRASAPTAEVQSASLPSELTDKYLLPVSISIAGIGVLDAFVKNVSEGKVHKFVRSEPAFDSAESAAETFCAAGASGCDIASHNDNYDVSAGLSGVVRVVGSSFERLVANPDTAKGAILLQWFAPWCG